MYSKIELPYGKVARHCDGCHLFASCKQIIYLDGKSLWLCGNCLDFCSKTYSYLIKNKINHKNLKILLRKWRKKKEVRHDGFRSNKR